MTKNLTARMNKKLTPIRVKNNVTLAIQLKLHKRMNKKQILIVTSYGRNKTLDNEIKKTKRRPIIDPAIAVRLLIRNDVITEK